MQTLFIYWSIPHFIDIETKTLGIDVKTKFKNTTKLEKINVLQIKKKKKIKTTFYIPLSSM